MAGAVGAFAVTAAIGFEFAIVAVAQQRVVVGIGFEVDAAAAAAVSAGGAAAGNVFFTAKRDTAIAAVAGFYVDFGFVNEHQYPAYDGLGGTPQKAAATKTREYCRISR